MNKVHLSYQCLAALKVWCQGDNRNFTSVFHIDDTFLWGLTAHGWSAGLRLSLYLYMYAGTARHDRKKTPIATSPKI